MEKEFDPPVTQETKLRMSFLERYEGFCIDVIKVQYLTAYDVIGLYILLFRLLLKI